MIINYRSLYSYMVPIIISIFIVVSLYGSLLLLYIQFTKAINKLQIIMFIVAVSPPPLIVIFVSVITVELL